jgi:hypothetical protein
MGIMKEGGRMNHTPTPWDVQNKGILGSRSARHEVVAGKVDISIPNQPTICKMPDLSGRSYANARFIVQAVNSHDELLDLLKIGLRIFGGHLGGEGDAVTGIEIEQRINLLNQYKATIDKIEVELNL